MAIIHIAGHLGADAESKVTPTGLKVITLRVATNIRRAGKDETVWFRVTVWGDRYDKMVPYLKKGSAVMIVGRLDKPEIYTDKEGRPQVSLNITADIVEFPPFGKPDKPGAQPGQGNQESGYGANPYNDKNSGSGYAGNQSTTGQGSYQQSLNDADALPF